MTRKVSAVPFIPDDVCRKIISEIPNVKSDFMAATNQPDIVEYWLIEYISMMRVVLLKVDPVIVIVTLTLEGWG